MIDDQYKREQKKAHACIFRLLKLRLRSEKEIRDHLKRKNFSQSVIEHAAEYFKQADLINDRTFAKAWIASRLARPFGINRIRYELIQKGIDKELLNSELDQAKSRTDEQSSVRELALKQNAKHARLDKLKRKQRVYGYLLRKGFQAETINKVLREL